MAAMGLTPEQTRRLKALAAKDRRARDAAKAARAELVEQLRAVRGDATVRELAETTEFSFQRIQQLIS